MHKKYGPIVRLGPKNVSVSDAGAIKIIYSAGAELEIWCIVFSIQRNRGFYVFLKNRSISLHIVYVFDSTLATKLKLFTEEPLRLLLS